jgi:trans-aconitate methyltransferase
MLPKPAHLETRYAEQFQDQSIVNAYHHRAPYPAEVFNRLAGLIPQAPRIVLDIGCGTGDVARPLAKLVDRVDAVDFSEPMLEKGRGLPGGDNPNLNWIFGRVEDAVLNPPYNLITAGESLHWMDWSVVFPRFRELLTSDGYLVVVGRSEKPSPWKPTLFELIPQYTTNKDYQAYDLIEELVKRQLFQPLGWKVTELVSISQPIKDYIEALHSRNGFSRDRMVPDAALAFDAKFREILLPYSQDGKVEYKIEGSIIWGKPL